ncbi:hypothetical protein MUK42_28930 [Musa troglodytarum]|uniref:Uncharacterized protein n=1 Tax=Musa troglodytarum TaxID=320322 RepID=A0A9E7K9L7_9LILI|nr:hypothetical protein MUK42_28930 [Musa troglodytarum]
MHRPLLLTYFTFPTSHRRFGPLPSFRGCITRVDKSMFGLEELVVVEKEESRTPSSGEGGTLKAALQLAAQLVRHHIHRYS